DRKARRRLAGHNGCDGRTGKGNGEAARKVFVIEPCGDQQGSNGFARRQASKREANSGVDAAKAVRTGPGHVRHLFGGGQTKANAGSGRTNGGVSLSPRAGNDRSRGHQDRSRFESEEKMMKTMMASAMDLL